MLTSVSSVILVIFDQVSSASLDVTSRSTANEGCVCHVTWERNAKRNTLCAFGVSFWPDCLESQNLTRSATNLESLRVRQTRMLRKLVSAVATCLDHQKPKPSGFHCAFLTVHVRRRNLRRRSGTVCVARRSETRGPLLLCHCPVSLLSSSVSTQERTRL